MTDKFESDFLEGFFDDEKQEKESKEQPQRPKHTKPGNVNVQSDTSDFVDVKVPQQREVNSAGQPVKGLQQGQRVQSGQIKNRNGQQRPQQRQGGQRPPQGQQRPQQGGQRPPQGQQRPQGQVRNVAPRSTNGVQRQSAKPSDPNTQRQQLQNPYAQEQVQQQNNKKPKKPKKVKKSLTKKQKITRGIIGGVIGLLVVVSIVLLGLYKNREVPIQTEYDETGRRGIDEYIQAVTTYNKEAITKLIGDKSYLVQEEEYANGSEFKLQFISKICGTVKADYPMVEQKSNKGRVYKDKKTGATNSIESDMTDGEEVDLTIVDYSKIAKDIETNSVEISTLFQSKGYTVNDLNIDKEMEELFCEYICSLQELPLKQVKWTPKLNDVGQVKGTEDKPVEAPFYVVTEDESMDKLLFGSDEFHNCLDAFGKAAISWTPTVTVTQPQEVENPEYTDYMAQYNALVQAYTDRGEKYPGKEGILYKYNKKKMKLKKNKKGKYTKIKKPEEKIIQDVTMEVDNPYNSDIVLPWTFLGAEFCQNRNTNGGKVLPEVGTGTFDRPAGIGTSVITKALASDGNYYDVKITLTGMWAGQSAIDYAVKYSEKNRGFLSNNSVQLVIFEMTVQNLSGVDFHMADDLILADRNANSMSKTGIIYGLNEEFDIHAGETVTLQDFQASQVIEDKYLIWGKSFNRVFEPVWFKVLANDVESLNEMLGVETSEEESQDTESESSEESTESDEN